MYSFFENSGGKLPEQEALVYQFLLQKLLILFLWYLRNYYSSMPKTSYWGIIFCPYSKTIGLIRVGFTNWDLWSFSQGDLLQDCSAQRSCTDFHVLLVHILSLKLESKKLQLLPFLEHIYKFNLDLCSQIYSNYPQVSFLGMNPGRGQNPNLEGSYIP